MPDYAEAPYPEAQVADRDRDASPIDHALYKLDGEINELDDVARALCQRLDRVLAPPTPQTGDRLAEVRKEQAPLAMALRESSDRVHDIRDRLLNVLHRLEL